MIGRIVLGSDFERVLARRPRERSAHFGLHHLPAAPGSRGRKTKLSTVCEEPFQHAVDDIAVTGCWLGCVVPKRHARRAVTRNLLRRQIRASAERWHAQLPAGLWVVRLRHPFDVRTFVSADSQPLRQAARAELDALFAAAATGPAQIDVASA